MPAIITILGRPNVGKSSLFNALLRKRIAITSEISGVTRDRIYQRLKLEKGWVWLVDTGGFIISKHSSDPINKKVLMQIEYAMNETDVCLFLVDAECEITEQDLQFARLLRKKGKNVWLIVNKIDKTNDLSAFYKLGFGEPIGISALHKQGISDLKERLDKYAASIPIPKHRDAISIACFGKPNVGKSSLINKILGEERVIVSEIPGTTRDRIQIPYKFEDNELILIDTAGLRRKSKIRESLEFYSLLRTLRAITMTDVGILLLDANDEMTNYEIRLCQELLSSYKAVLIAFNKTDILDNKEQRFNYIKDRMSFWIPFFSYIPWFFISAKTGRGIKRLIREALAAARRRKQHISTTDLNSFLKQATLHYAPPAGKHRRRVKIGFLQQVSGDIPHFVVYGRHLNDLPSNYRRYLLGQFYKHFSFSGVPLKIEYKEEKENNQKL